MARKWICSVQHFSMLASAAGAGHRGAARALLQCCMGRHAVLQCSAWGGPQGGPVAKSAARVPAQLCRARLPCFEPLCTTLGRLLQVGYKTVPDRKVTKPELGHLQKAGAPAMKHLREFKVGCCRALPGRCRSSFAGSWWWTALGALVQAPSEGGAWGQAFSWTSGRQRSQPHRCVVLSATALARWRCSRP